MMEKKENIFSVIQNNRDKIISLGVKRLGLFGSFVRNQQRTGSDIDLLVEFSPGQKSFDNFIHLSFLLEELLNRRIELVTPESISPYIKPRITKEVEYVIHGV